MFEKRYTLLRSQKKRVYDILREVGLEPAEFSWTTERVVERLAVSKLMCRDGDYYFQFSSCELNAWCIACPGLYRTMDYQYPKSWEEQERLLRQWAEGLKRELETQDPWRELAKYQVGLNWELSGGVVNEPISAVEADRIGQALARLADSVTQEFSLNSEPARVVRARLDFLAEAARRERSRDWAYMVVGVCTTTALALSLTEQETVVLWGMVKSELSLFVHLSPAKTEPTQQKGRILGIQPATRTPEQESDDRTPQPSDKPGLME